MKTRSLRRIASLMLVAAVSAVLTGCQATAESDVTVVVGYQSKTINTVTAGTLLRARGYFEKRLEELGTRAGKHYKVSWQDYSTGAPITAQMLAGKTDIGSMGDFPLLINGSRAQKLGDDGTKIVSITGYNPHGALNMVVVRPDSNAEGLGDLRGQAISTSVGSAAHGTLVHALEKAGMNPGKDVRILNQDPAVGATALDSGAVQGLSQFVAWPGQLVFEGKAKALYDGAELNLPTLHGVVMRNKVLQQQPDVAKAFLQAQLDATNYLHQNPLAAAEQVAKATGLPPEVVYLYDGSGGQVSFDPTIKSIERQALATDLPFLKAISQLDDLDLASFVDDGPLRSVYGPQYAKDVGSLTNPIPVSGRDPVTGSTVDNPATASELWLTGENQTHPAATPTTLLRQIRQDQAQAKVVRAAYVPDATTGTRWFADKSSWVLDPNAAPESRYLPFTTPEGARNYLAAHPGALELSYADALKGA